jgi:hypothetical protein
MVTGGRTGIASGGSDDIHFGTAGIFTSTIFKLLSRISGIGITQPGCRVLS